MRYYIGVVHKDEGSAYGIHFPDIPGCFSAADNIQDLLTNGTEALALYLEDHPAPEARSLDQIKNDPEVMSDLARGAALLAFPAIQLTGRSAKANITMDAGLLSAIDKTAKQRGLTRSAFLADIARREIIGEHDGL